MKCLFNDNDTQCMKCLCLFISTCSQVLEFNSFRILFKLVLNFVTLGSLTFDEFLIFLDLMCNGTLDQRIAWLFRYSFNRINSNS